MATESIGGLAVQTKSLLGYIERDSFMHSLNGASKLILMLLASIAAMLGFDTRFLLLVTLLSLLAWKMSKLKMRDLYIVFWFIFVFMLLNNLFVYLFAPEYGVWLYGTKHLWAELPFGYTITAEQAFYQLNLTLKYFTVIPITLIFIATTSPSEFAAALNKIGVSYRFAYSMALALRYIPDVQREFRDISYAGQARGIDISADAKLTQRIRNVSSILFPLVLSTFTKIETISAAMELRGFGQQPRRTWYQARPFRLADYLVISLGVALVILAGVLIYVNGGRFYNPFI